MYAAVLKTAVDQGKKVADGVHLYIQFGSQDIRRYAESKGYLDVFAKAGAELVDPSCGACIKAGPGVSDSPDQVTVSAINRNFPGRSGPGKVYLASPRRERLARSGHGQRDQPQLSGSQRAGQSLPREPARRRRERDCRSDRLPRLPLVKFTARSL
jgi:hypothetical protein